MNISDTAWRVLKNTLGEDNFYAPMATDMGPAKTGPSDIDLARRGPKKPRKFPSNPKVPSNRRGGDSTYDFSIAGEHPLRDLEGAHGEGASFGSSPKEVGPTMQDPKLRTVSQEEFDRNRSKSFEESLDTSTPFDPFKKSYALEMAWRLLKADPAAQMRDRMGTIPDPIMGMLARQGLSPEDVEIPMENLRPLRQRFSETSRFIPEVQHEDDGMGNLAEEGKGRVTPAHFKGGEVTPGPEEGFLTPAQQFRTDPSFAANLRRNVGGQQAGGIMQATGTGNRGFKRIDQTQSTGPRAQLGRMEGVARGMRLRGRTKENLPPEVTAELTPQQKLMQTMQEMAQRGRGFGRDISFTADPSIAVKQL